MGMTSYVPGLSDLSISIADEDAEKTGTIGQLAAYIEDRLNKSDN